MKSYIYLLVFIIPVFASCQNNEKISGQGVGSNMFIQLKGGDVCYTIGDKYAGEFILGEEIPEQEYLDHFKIRKDKQSNMPCYIISENENDVIVLIPAEEKSGDKTIEIIKEIRVVANKFKTPRGITVNTDLEDLFRTYPSCYVSFNTNEEFITLVSEETEAQFLISKTDYLGDFQQLNATNPDITKFKPHTKVIEIRLL